MVGAPTCWVSFFNSCIPLFQEVYVDEELPDYIMVMVANHKDEKTMRDDLVLFLNENTGKRK
jgi:hypothetical protein